MGGITSKTAGKAGRLAREAARRYGHESIGPEHLLLGVLEEGAGIAIAVLRTLNVDPQAIREEIERILIAEESKPPLGKPSLTPQSKAIVEHALGEAHDLGHNYLGTEHLILGLMRDDDCVAGQVLFNLGVTLEGFREGVSQLGRREA
jgi:ATP-dependent Clp protease ATP-binding subunit ClpC